ncbi:MAG: hypothetical protein KDK40_03630, partial [Chlamydiia bacterium]|nr:hypothetical protein [Chlamydiia bacterium]
MMNFPEIDRDEESETARHRYLLLCEKRRVEALTLSVKEMEQRIKRLQEFEHLSRRQSQQIQQLEEANRLLQAQNQDQLQVQEHLNSEKQSSLASYEELKKQFEQKSEECFLVGEELNAVREELSSLKHSNTLVNGQVAELTERISTEQNRFEELHQNKIEIEEELATVQNLHVKLISETKALKNKVQELQREGQFHEQNRTEVQSELDQAKKRLEERSKDFEHLHREMQRIKKTLIEGIKENKALEERFVSVVQEKAQLQASLSASSEIQQQQMRTIESLQLKSEEEHLCAQKQEAKIASLNEALDLQRTRQSLDAQRYRALEEEKREVEKKLEALAAELKDTHAVVDNYREDLVAIQLGARQEREEKAEVQRQLDEMTALHEKEKTARAALEGELKQLQESLTLSSSRESECKKTISEREQELSELQKAHGELHEELMTLKRQITS